MALQWREALERMDGYLKELLSSGLLLLHAQLGVDVGLKAELLPPGLLACVAAGLGLLLVLLLWFSVCRCFSKKPAEGVAPEAGKIFKPKSEEVKKRSRKRGGDKKVQRNGQAVDLEEELKPVENQNLSESPDPASGKSEKGKKNKKKTKAQVKDTKSTSERREPEEGTWETKVSQREKRQQRRKDKGTGDESGSPGGTELGTNAAVEEPNIVSAPSVTSMTTIIITKSSNTSTSSSTPKSSNTSTSSSTATLTTNSSNPTTSNTTKISNTTKSSNPTTSSTTKNTKSSNPTTSNTTTRSSNSTTSNTTTRSSNPTTSNTTTKSSNPTTSNTTTKSSNPIASNTTTTDSTKNTKSSNPTSAPKAQKNSPRTKLVVPPVEHDPPVAEVTRAVIPPGSPAWDVIGVNGSGSWDLGMSVPPHSQTWNSVNPETSVWPQDMEGSWMMVDGSHIPVSLHGVPESSWACPAPVDDEWSGPNSSSADPASDYCAPCEEWGNYEEPAGGTVPPVEPQDSDPEKDRDELAAPGSSKSKRKKKKKKKAEETGDAAQVEGGGAKDQQAAGSMLPKNMKEQEVMVPPVLLKPIEPEVLPKSTAPPTRKKPEENLEPQKQVKKKKARRET